MTILRSIIHVFVHIRLLLVGIWGYWWLLHAPGGLYQKAIKCIGILSTWKIWTLTVVGRLYIGEFPHTLFSMGGTFGTDFSFWFKLRIVALVFGYLWEVPFPRLCRLWLHSVLIVGLWRLLKISCLLRTLFFWVHCCNSLKRYCSAWVLWSEKVSYSPIHCFI